MGLFQTGRQSYLTALRTTWSQKEFCGIVTSEGNQCKKSNDFAFARMVNHGIQPVLFTESLDIYNRLKSRNHHSKDLAKKHLFLRIHPLVWTWPAESAYINGSRSDPSHATIPTRQKFPQLLHYRVKLPFYLRWQVTQGMWVVASWALPPQRMKRAGPLGRSRYHGECSSMEAAMQAIRVLGVAWFNARLFAYAGIRDCSLRCQGWLAFSGGWLGSPQQVRWLMADKNLFRESSDKHVLGRWSLCGSA